MATILWLTGLSGSGKTTICNKLIKVLKKNYKLKILDGDQFRNNKHYKNKFDRKSIITNNSLIIKHLKNILRI